VSDLSSALRDLGLAVVAVAEALDRRDQELLARLDRIERSDRVLTVAQAAEALGVSRATVHRMVASGELPTFTGRDGRRVTRIPAWALQGRAA
jgi:excisionase family DNA binding protein